MHIPCQCLQKHQWPLQTMYKTHFTSIHHFCNPSTNLPSCHTCVGQSSPGPWGPERRHGSRSGIRTAHAGAGDQPKVSPTQQLHSWMITFHMHVHTESGMLVSWPWLEKWEGLWSPQIKKTLKEWEWASPKGHSSGHPFPSRQSQGQNGLVWPTLQNWKLDCH